MRMRKRLMTVGVICSAALMGGEAAAAICSEGNKVNTPSCVAVEIYFGDQEFAALNGCSYAVALDVEMLDSNSGGRYLLNPSESVQIDYSDEQEEGNTDARLVDYSFSCCANVDMGDGQLSSCG